MSNLKKGVFITILIILGIGVLFLVKIKLKQLEEFNEEEEIKFYDAYSRMMQEKYIPKRESEILEMAIRGDWGEAREYFSKEFRKKHNENESVLNIKIDDFSFDGTYVGDDINEYRWNVRQYIIISGDRKYRYYLLPKYNYDEHPGIFDIPVIDDIQIIDIVDLDSNDKENPQGVKFTKDTSAKLLRQMMFKYDGEAGLSKHFREKYPNFDGFYDKGGIPYEHKRYDGFVGKKFQIEDYEDGEFDYENRVIKGIGVLDVYRTLVYKCNLYFEIDENNYLYDYSLEKVSQQELSKTRPEYKDKYIEYPTYSDVSCILLSKNRDWSDLPLSKKFKDKYNSKDGILPNEPIDYVEYMCDTKGITKYPVRIYLLDGSIKYYGLIFKLTNTNLIDDIEKIELNVDGNSNYTVEELMSMF